MDLKIAAFLLVLFATVTISEGGKYGCCLKTSKRITRPMWKMDKYYIQQKGGFCEIDAVILHAKGRKYCLSSELLPVIEKLISSRKQRLIH
ncbi:hypothetical protein ANANG_G00267950 [Anguilla anguilla]|uniref:Chemokine interleukin-8-like domain-containing protein n=1 Tax=Anguilla anguilla TaxID=7936 RepID=A0A9D3RPG9_ANGAN|nr:hypothetical protein ANANG_G00267950 [Anguilla anguilla]